MRATAAMWDKLPADHPMAMLTRRRMIGDKVMVSHITLERGFKLATHQHENEQISCVISGQLKFGLGNPGSPDYREETVSAGGVLLLPSNCPHAAEAIETTVVLDIFAPPSAGTGIDAKR